MWLYGLPKIHKPNCPFRVIISSIDSPLYSLVTYLHQIINSSISKANGYIGNSYDLYNSLNDKVLNSEFCLISLDFISLFTKIPIDLAMECLTERWAHISSNCEIPKKEFLKAVRLILDSTFFIFDNQCYKQNFETPMDSRVYRRVLTRELWGECGAGGYCAARGVWRHGGGGIAWRGGMTQRGWGGITTLWCLYEHVGCWQIVDKYYKQTGC